MSEPTLTPDRWQQIQELFHSALAQPPAERDDFLRASSADDTELRAAVASLLAAHDRSGLIGMRGLDPVDVETVIAAALAGRYELVRAVGRGGMATVFVAEDRKHRRKVAIKVLRPELALGVERFLREIEIAAGLQHPHILPLFDSGAADGLLYYVMPYVEGPTLAARLERDGALPVDETLRIAADVLGALDYAHRAGVVHRDIKPSNILLSTATGHALVADFGIARAISAAEADALTAPGVAIGTPGYMPPEQARGEGVTAATDIYSTAMVLHECLTGRHYAGEVTTGGGDWVGVPVALRPALEKGLRDDPHERWKDAGAFRRALLEPGRSRANPVRRWAAIVTAMAVVVLGAWRLLAPGTAVTTDTSRLVVLPFSVRGGGEHAYLGEGVVDLLSTKLDGAGSWRTVDPRAVLSLVNRSGSPDGVDPEAGRRIAGQLGASSYVLGNIIEVGSRIRIDASLYGPGPGGDRIGSASAEGEASEVLSVLDRLAADLLSNQGGPDGARLTQIAAITTQSLPALKSYLRGVQALRIGEFPLAAAAFQEAIALDSAFALAWYQLSIAADWLLRADMALGAADQAVRFADRLSERDRRLLEALRTIRLGDFQEAERRYRDIIATYPDDIEAWSQLGELLFHFGPRHGRSIDDSREAWNRLTQLEPDLSTAYIHLARVEAAHGNLMALDTLTRRALELAPGGDRGLEMRMLRAFVVGDPRALLQVTNDLRVAPDDLMGELVWITGTFPPELDAFETVLNVVTDSTRSPALQALGFGALAFVEASRGRFAAAREAVNQMMARRPVWGLEYGAYLGMSRALIVDTLEVRSYRDRLFLLDVSSVSASVNRAVWFASADGLHPSYRWYLVATGHALLGEDGLAAVYGDSLRGVTPPPGSGSLLPDQVRTVDALRARAAGSLPRALAALDQNRYHIWHQLAAASPFFSQGMERYLHAVTLEEAGRLDDAVNWYGSLFETSQYDRMFWAPAHLRLGRIHESRGELDAARRHYRSGIRLWADADPVLRPQVDDARAALARVGG